MNDNRDFYSGQEPYTAMAPAMSLSQYMARSFGWMFAGLMVTFVTAFFTVYSGLFFTLYATGLYLALSIAEIVLVVVLSAKVATLKPGTATALFFGYSVLNGLTLSVYFVMYEVPTLVLAFLLGAIYFGVMAVYGARTDKDLTGWGPKLMGGLIAMIVVSLLGGLFSLVFRTSFGVFDMLLCAVGLVLFMGLTAYDTQRLKAFHAYFAADEAMLQKSAILGALELYLDFINIFIRIVRLLGRNSRN